MFDLQAAEQSMTESMDEPITEQVGMDLTHEAEVQEEAHGIPRHRAENQAPPDAQVNEHGQKVWRDDNGDVWVQNRWKLKHNVLTGAWDPRTMTLDNFDEALD